MNIQVAVLCDAATDSDGKLNLLGAFDTIYAQTLPAIHPQCSIALRLVFSKMEEGHKEMKLTFVDEDGKLVMHPQPDGSYLAASAVFPLKLTWKPKKPRGGGPSGASSGTSTASSSEVVEIGSCAGANETIATGVELPYLFIVPAPPDRRRTPAAWRRRAIGRA